MSCTHRIRRDLPSAAMNSRPGRARTGRPGLSNNRTASGVSGPGRAELTAGKSCSPARATPAQANPCSPPTGAGTSPPHKRPPTAPGHTGVRFTRSKCAARLLQRQRQTWPGQRARRQRVRCPLGRGPPQRGTSWLTTQRPSRSSRPSPWPRASSGPGGGISRYRGPVRQRRGGLPQWQQARRLRRPGTGHPPVRHLPGRRVPQPPRQPPAQERHVPGRLRFPARPRVQGVLRPEPAEGKRHNAAVICLARRCDVILAMLRTRQPYQSTRHAPSLADAA
jgi:hypothetical protein